MKFNQKPFLIGISEKTILKYFAIKNKHFIDQDSISKINLPGLGAQKVEKRCSKHFKIVFSQQTK